MTESTKFALDFQTKRDQVLWLLHEYPQTRDNDFYLQLLWLRHFGKLTAALPFIEFSEINRLGGSLESVRRVRQKIQNEDGLYLPSPSTQARRHRKMEIFRTNIKRW